MKKKTTKKKTRSSQSSSSKGPRFSSRKALGQTISHRTLKTSEKKIVVAISGGFDPIHIGHIRLIKEARKLGDKLVVIMNNDNWLRAKKGREFMGENDRKEIIEAFAEVDKVYLTEHLAHMNYNNPIEKSVCHILEKIRPDIFANGGDRNPKGDPVPEVDLCNELGIKLIYNVGYGGKVRSSSDLVNSYKKNKKSKK